MTRKDKIILYGGISALTISYIIYNKWSKRIFYDEILKRIGGGAIKFSDLKVWNKSFLLNLKSKGKAFAEYQQDYLKYKSEVLRDSIKGGGTDEDAILGVFRNFNSKSGIAQLVSFYNAKYNRSLKEDLEGDLSSGYLQQIGSIVSSKPDAIFLK